MDNKSGKLLCVKTCDLCGKNVNIYHKRRLKNEHVFCSRKCMGEFMKLNNPNNVTCICCGKQFHKKPYEIKKSKTKMFCCSYKCISELRKRIYLGENNPNYGNCGINNPLHKTTRRISSHGYYLVEAPENHPFAINGIWIREHRLVAEKFLLTDEYAVEINGEKYLNPIYDVHHKDFNKLNNSPDNLMILTRAEHQAFHQAHKKMLGKKGCTEMNKFYKISIEQFMKDFLRLFPSDSIDEIGKIEELYEEIKLPKRATKGSAGYDFFLPFDLDLKPHESIIIPTGIKCQIEDKWFLSVYPRSGLGFKNNVYLATTISVIDSDYFNCEKNEGHIMIKLVNGNEDKTLVLNKGEAFIQTIFLPYGITVDDEADGVRKGGMGSTDEGKN